MKKPDLENIRAKLYERLKPSDWADRMKGFLLSADFEKILVQLETDVNDGNRFTPSLKQVFRALEECPYKDLKVVIIAQDPYPQQNMSDGLAFSCGNTREPQPSLD